MKFLKSAFCIIAMSLVCAIAPAQSLSSLWKEYEKIKTEDKPKSEMEILGHIKTAALEQGAVWDYYRAGKEYVNAGGRRNWKQRDSLQEALDKEIETLDNGLVSLYYLHRQQYWSLGRLRDFVQSGKEKTEKAKTPTGPMFCGELDFPNDYVTALSYLGCIEQMDSLNTRFRNLRLENAGQLDYRILHSDVKELAEFWPDAKDLLDELESGSVTADISNGVLTLSFKNTEKTRLEMKDEEGKTVWKTTIKNPINSFYVRDKYYMNLPPLPDGEYSFTLDGKNPQSYSQISLSVARDLTGDELYVADYYTGQPVEGYKMEIRDVDVLRVKYTGPDGLLRLSDWIAPVELDAPGRPEPSAIVLTSSGAYHPSDTLKYKIIGFNLPENALVRLEARNADYEEIMTAEHSLNSWGSACGEFVLPSSGKSGYIWLNLFCGDKYLGFQSVYSGDYVLSNFEVLCDKQQQYWFPGDTVRLSGRVRTSSGRPFLCKSASIEINGIIDGERRTFTKEVELDSLGRCYVDVAGAERWLDAVFSITEASGETVKAKTGVSVYDRPVLHLTVKAKNEAGEYVVPDLGSALPSEELRLSFDTRFPVDSVSWRIKEHGEVVASGVSKGEDVYCTLPRKSAQYLVEANCAYRGRESQRVYSDAVVVLEDEHCLGEEFKAFVLPRGELGVQLGCTMHDIWAVVRLQREDGSLLEYRKVYIVGEAGARGCVQTIEFERPASERGPLSIMVFWFRDSGAETWCHEYKNSLQDSNLPLYFESFVDKSDTRVKNFFTIRTSPGAEAAFTVYDKSIDLVNRQNWPDVDTRTVRDWRPQYAYRCGRSSSVGIRPFLKAEGAMMDLAAPAVRGNAIEEEDAAADEEIQLRSDMLDVLAFEPVLYPDADGRVQFSFTSADKLSTYVVKVYAHSKDGLGRSIQREFLVTRPVELRFTEPQFLYSGDLYRPRVAIYAAAAQKGVLTMEITAGKDVLLSESRELILRGGAAEYEAEGLRIPEGISDVKIKFTFSCKAGSDGLLVSCPVYPNEQQLTEAHSALLLSGMDREALVQSLKAQFQNPGGEFTVSERDVAAILSDVLDTDKKPDSDNAVALMEAIFVRALSASISGTEAATDSLCTKLLALRTEGGGFAWMPGMEPNAYVTAYILACCAQLRSRRCLPSALAELGSTVTWLDSAPLPVDLYCLVRSRYAGQPLGKMNAARRREVKNFLTSKDKESYTGHIITKARRVLASESLLSSPEGVKQAKQWGLGLTAKKRLRSTVSRDAASLAQYAQPHPMGGSYFPNAVMPLRGLLESEIYAHLLLTEVFAERDAALADHLRLWIMVQKETQRWDSDPTAVMAYACVLDGSKELLDSRIVSLSRTTALPFAQIQASGNGMSADVQWERRQADGSWRPLAEGESLSAGTRLRAVIQLWSAQNRSLARLELQRPACLLPVNQKSGYSRLWLYGLYRDVKKSSTRYWFNTLPEENFTLTEEFTVSQGGVFQAPASTIQCLYAPHWSANTKGLSMGK
ncbi:MAG: alpha-2-macroglobulin family protein [Candidatus Cryptobacteroides sp.]